jgi:DnaJ-class molecular chaperone
LQYHPDRNNGSTEAAEKMKSINEAYAVLSNSEKRREYDGMKARYGSSAYNHFRHTYSEQDIFQGSDIASIFEELARSFGLRGFDDIFKGTAGTEERTFHFRRNGITGWGYIVTGKPDVDTNDKRKQRVFSRHTRTGIPEKLARYAFKRLSGLGNDFAQGKDIVDIITLSPQQARNGGPYEYMHWRRDKKITVKIPPGIREGQKIRIAGLGEKGKDGNDAGNLYLKVRIKRPLRDKVTALITSFAQQR